MYGMAGQEHRTNPQEMSRPAIDLLDNDTKDDIGDKYEKRKVQTNCLLIPGGAIYLRILRCLRPAQNRDDKNKQRR